MEIIEQNRKGTDRTLLIMAAGSSKRYGRLKQIDSIGPHGEFIIDYSIYDAIKAGFNKIVFVIKKENLDIFKSTIGKRVSPFIRTEYVFQDDFRIDGKKVPLGTATAILCAKEKIREQFVVINADDFYGRDSYKKMMEFMKKSSCCNQKYGMIGYPVNKTLSENGTVKRAICEVLNDCLSDITTCYIKKENANITAQTVDGNNPYPINDSTIASMNMYLFPKEIFSIIEAKTKEFLLNNKYLTKELLITDIIKDLIHEAKIQIKVLEISEKWYGVTYLDDKEKVATAINQIVENRIYPKKMW